MIGKISRRAKPGTNLSDVARLAGVSSMTVSRVINKEPGVKVLTRERVLAAITSLDYVPNAAARSLAGAGPLRIVLLYSNPSAAYLSEFLLGSLKQASLSDAQLIVEQCDPAMALHQIAARLENRGVDGVILPAPLCDDPRLIRLIEGLGLPTVVVATGAPPPGVHSVTIDDCDAARGMTARLIAAGHRRIGFIRGDTNQTSSAKRFEGYVDALAAAGLQVEASLTAEGDFTYRSGLAAAQALLSRSPRPTAIFASNDDMAAAAMAVAHRMGLAIPADLSICGFDDTVLATAVWPTLTTVRQPISDMAQCAVDILVESVRCARAGEMFGPQHRLLDYRIIERDSDAPTG